MVPTAQVELGTMTWITVAEYLCHKLPRIYPTCRKHFPVLSSYMTYHQVCNQRNNTGDISWCRNCLLFRGTLVHTRFLMGFQFLDLQFCVYCFGDRCLSFPFGHSIVCFSDYPFGIFKLFLLVVNMFSIMNRSEILLTCD